MVHTYAELHSDLGPVLGFDGIVILDGRWSRDRQIEEAKAAGHRENAVRPHRKVTKIRIGHGRFSACNYSTGLIAIGVPHE